MFVKLIGRGSILVTHFFGGPKIVNLCMVYRIHKIKSTILGHAKIDDIGSQYSRFSHGPKMVDVLFSNSVKIDHAEIKYCLKMVDFIGPVMVDFYYKIGNSEINHD